MKKVYIVGNHSFIFGVFQQKANAIIHKQQRKKFDNEKNIHIKKRVNKYGYRLDDWSQQDMEMWFKIHMYQIMN